MCCFLADSFIQNGVGAVPSPFDCYMALRGLKTLHVRLEAAGKNALVSPQYSHVVRTIGSRTKLAYQLVLPLRGVSANW